MTTHERHKPLILVTGANGQLGMAVRAAAVGFDDFDFLFADRTLLDVTLGSHVRSFLHEHRPSVVINCAAYTNVERAESEEEVAYMLNAKAPEFLARECQEIESLLVHFSTDYVLDGLAGVPYTESDAPAPLSAYGRTKLEGELLIDGACHRYLIVRTSWLYGLHGHNFYRTMLRLAKEQDTLKVVSDQVATPTFAHVLAEDILSWMRRLIIETRTTDYGVFHYSHEGEASWWEFAKAIVEGHQLNSEVIPVTTAEYPTKAVRPAYSKLNSSKFYGETEIRPVHWKDALTKCITLNESYGKD